MLLDGERTYKQIFLLTVRGDISDFRFQVFAVDTDTSSDIHTAYILGRQNIQ